MHSPYQLSRGTILERQMSGAADLGPTPISCHRGARMMASAHPACQKTPPRSGGKSFSSNPNPNRASSYNALGLVVLSQYFKCFPVVLNNLANALLNQPFYLLPFGGFAISFGLPRVRFFIVDFHNVIS